MLSSHIVSHVPASGAVNVSVTTSISVVMDDKFREVKTASAMEVFPAVTEMSLAAALSARARAVSGVVAYDKASKTLTFAPSTPLAANTKYQVCIRAEAFTSAADFMRGHSMSCDEVFFFTTEGAREIELHVEVRGLAKTRGSFRLNLAGGALDALKAAAVAAVTPPATLTAVKAFSASVVGVTIPLRSDADVMELQDGDLIVIDLS